MNTNNNKKNLLLIALALFLSLFVSLSFTYIFHFTGIYAFLCGFITTWVFLYLVDKLVVK